MNLRSLKSCTVYLNRYVCISNLLNITVYINSPTLTTDRFSLCSWKLSMLRKVAVLKMKLVTETIAPSNNSYKHVAQYFVNVNKSVTFLFYFDRVKSKFGWVVLYLFKRQKQNNALTVGSSRKMNDMLKLFKNKASFGKIDVVSNRRLVLIYKL